MKKATTRKGKGKGNTLDKMFLLYIFHYKNINYYTIILINKYKENNKTCN